MTTPAPLNAEELWICRRVAIERKSNWSGSALVDIEYQPIEPYTRALTASPVNAVGVKVRESDVDEEAIKFTDEKSQIATDGRFYSEDKMTAYRNGLFIGFGCGYRAALAVQPHVNQLNTSPEHVKETAENEHKAVQPQDGWRDIESAPKDGTKVLTIKDQYDPGLAWYEDGEWWTYHMVEARKFSNQQRYAHKGCYEPTHWQPLPAAPSNEKGGE